QHERPADGPELLVDTGAGAPVCRAAVRRRRLLAAPALAFAAVEDDLDGLVPREGALDLVVELAAMPGDDEQVLGDGCVLGRAAGERLPAVPARRLGLGHQLEEARRRGPRGAPAGGAGRVAELEALVAVETEGQLLEREVQALGQHPGAIEHLVVILHVPRSKTQSSQTPYQKSAT